MEINTGLRGLLSFAWLYELAQSAIGANYSRQWQAKHLWRIQPDAVVVDAGCGPGTTLRHIPANAAYFGFDISERYIAAARSNFSDRGEFLLGDATAFLKEKPKLAGNVDLVFTIGVLHHIDNDTALELFRVAHELLKPGGRFVTLEPTYLRHQHWLSSWLVSKDRGQHVRQEQEWKDLIEPVFPTFKTSILTGLIRIPYVHVAIEGVKT